MSAQNSSALDINLLLIDDHEVIRHGLMMAIRDYVADNPQSGIQLRSIVSASDAKEGFEIIQTYPVDVIFVDIILPDISGLKLIKQLRESGIKREMVKIAVVTEVTDLNLKELITIGANAYINKQESTSTFIEAIKFMMMNPDRFWMQPEYAQKLGRIETALMLYKLTQMEIEVLQLIHLSNNEIAELLNLSPNTVRSHLANVYDKLNVHTRLEAQNFVRIIGLRSWMY